MIMPFFYLFGTIFFFSALAFSYYAFNNARLMRGPLGHRLMAVGGIIFVVAMIVGAVDHFFFPGSGLVYVELFIWIAGLSVIVGGGVLRAKEIQRVYRVPLFWILTMIPSANIYLAGIVTLVFISLPISMTSALSALRSEPRWIDAGNIVLWAFSFAIMAMAERRFHLAVQLSAATVGVVVEQEMLLREDILALRAYLDLANRLSVTMVPMTGVQALRDVSNKCADEHDILRDFEMTDEGALTVERTADNLATISEEDRVLDGLSALISRFIDLYSAVASPEFAKDVVAKSYQATKERYGDIPAFLRLFRTMPEGFLEEEKLALLSREELEARVKERTKDLEKALAKEREATEAFRASQASFHNIVERSTDGIIIVDQKGIVRFVNPAAESFFGRKAEELVGGLFGFPVLAGRVTELDIIGRDGEGVAELRMVETEWKGEVAYLALLRDITERKQAEEERERLILELREALAKIKTLRGLIPICASCKKIRDDEGYWNQLEVYIQAHSDAVFSHGICPGCAKKLYPGIFAGDEYYD